MSKHSRFSAIGVCLVAMSAAISGAAEPWQPRCERVIQLVGQPRQRSPVVTAVAIQPHGDLLAAAGDDHLVRLWNMRTGQLRHRLTGHRDWVTTVAFSSDGTELVTGSRDRRVLVWDVEEGRLLNQLGSHDQPISALACSRETEMVAVLAFRSPLKLFDLPSRQQARALACPCGDMRAIAVAPNLQHWAGGGRNGRIRVWDLQTDSSYDLMAHQRRIRALAFTDDRRLVSAGEDQAIRVWDLDSRRQLHQIGGDLGKVLAMVMVGTDRLATAGADNLIRLWDLLGSEPLAELEGHTGSIAALDAGDGVLVSGSFDTTIRVWSLAAQPEPPGLVLGDSRSAPRPGPTADSKR